MSRALPVVEVHKFGGAALGGAAAIRQVVGLLSGSDGAARPPRVVVASALAGVTDALLGVLAQAGSDRAGAQAAAQAMRERHLALALELLRDGARAPACACIGTAFDELQAALVAGGGAQPPSRQSDRLLAWGERLAATLLAGALGEAGTPAQVVDAAELIVTDGRAGAAAPDLARSEPAIRAALLPLLEGGIVAVVPGFIGAGPEGEVVTLGRGGSDLTATILGRALGAPEITLWKDVPGLLTADPRIVPGARVLPLLDAREAAELAYFGAKVLHPRALTPLGPRSLLRVRPFADPSASGSAIVTGSARGGSPVRALSALQGQALVTVAGNGMLGVPGVAARTFGALAEAGISVSLISQASSEHSICFTVPDAAAQRAEQALRAAFREELARGDIDEIAVLGGLATVAVVGSGMARTPGIAARVFGAAAGAGVNVVAIAQGSSERNISLVVEAERAGDALRAIHTAFQLDKVGGGRPPRRGADLVLLGFGRIGRQLVEQIQGLAGGGRGALRVVGVVDRGGFVFDRRGLGGRRLAALAAYKERGQSVAAHGDGRAADVRAAIDFIAEHALARPVLVDVASGDTRPALLAAVEHGMDLVLANKVPLAGDGEAARALLHHARRRGRRVLHEATVGAGLPLIDTIEKLIASGDRVLTVEGCPSGTLGYLFGELGRGRPFSQALRQAMALGYTETDPREDLSGMDVARKGLILGRMLGFAGELADLSVESLVPEELRAVPLHDFRARIDELDAGWAARVAAARAQGQVLRYRVRATPRSVRVGLVGVPIGSSLAALEGTDNQFAITTRRYRETPLVISGPGAGPAVTAAGVLNDIQRVVASRRS